MRALGQIPQPASGPALVSTANEETFGLRLRGAGLSLLIHATLLILAATFRIQPEPEEPPAEPKLEAMLVRLPPIEEEPGSESGKGAGSPTVEESGAGSPKPTPRQLIRATSRVAQVAKPMARATANLNPTRVAQIQPTRVAPTVTPGVKVQPIQRPQAPTAVTPRTQIQTSVVAPLEQSELSVPRSVVSPSATPTLRAVPTVAATDGPRDVEATGPTISIEASDYSGPVAAESAVGDIAGNSPDAAQIESLLAGSGSGSGAGLLAGSGAGNGRGNGPAAGRGGFGAGGSGGGSGAGNRGSGIGDGNGSGTGSGDGRGGPSARSCTQDPTCMAYLKLIRDRVSARWRPDPGVPGGKVRLSFRIDGSGAAYTISMVQSDNPSLGASCLDAFRTANPFPPPPPSIAYLLRQNIVAIFEFDRGSS